MRLYKEEKEFLKDKVAEKYRPVLVALKEDYDKELETAILKAAPVQTFLNAVNKLLTTTSKTTVGTYCNIVQVNVEDETHKFEGRFSCGNNFYVGSWDDTHPESDSYDSLYTSVAMKTKAPKDENDRYDTILPMIDEIGNAVVNRFKTKIQEDLANIKRI